MNISLVIPNYNGRRLLEQNLPKVLQTISHYKSGSVEIVVVDDGSNDDSWDFLFSFADKHKNVHILQNEKNFGFSTTVNRGVAKANGQIVILLNTDVVPEDRFLERVVDHFKNDTVFAVGFMDKSIEHDKTVLRGRGIGSWQKGFLLHRRGEVDKTNTLWASGGSSAFRKSMWSELGGLHEVYNPFYWEDIDLSYRALKSGFKVVFDPEIVVIHEHEKGAIKTHYTDQKITVTAYRNQYFFVWLNITDTRLILEHIVWMPYHLLKAFVKGDKVLLTGFYQALKSISRILLLRKSNTKNFVVSDQTILQQFRS